MDDLNWPRVVNKVVTEKWSQLKNTLVMKDFVDYLIEKRVVTLDYWICLKSKPISESERTEDFLFQVMKFDRKKYNYFLEALLTIHRKDLVTELVKVQDVKLKQYTSSKSGDREQKLKQYTSSKSGDREHKLKPKSSKSLENSRRKDDRTVMEKSSKSLTCTDQFQPQRNLKEPPLRDVRGKGRVSKMNGDQLPDGSPTAHVQVKQGGEDRITAPGSELKVNTRRMSIADAKTGKALINHESSKRNDSTGEYKNNSNQPDTTLGHTYNKHQTDRMAGQRDDIHSTDKTPGQKDDNHQTDKKPGQKDDGQTSRPTIAKSREEVLSIREQEIKHRETVIEEKEKQLKQQEDTLKRMESELLTRGNSLAVIEDSDPPPLSMSIPHDLQLELSTPYDSIPPTASTTQSSDVLADVHEQLKAIRNARAEQIEREHGSPADYENEEYVRLTDFQNVQKDIEEIKFDIATDREHREVLQEKIEDLKEEIEMLHRKIRQLECEKEQNNADSEKEIIKLKTDLKQSQENHTAAINGLMLEMRAKQEQCTLLERNMKEIITDADELEKRVDILEVDKEKFESEIVRYEKEISDLRRELSEKEGELGEMRKVLEDTESEKEDLVEELATLKSEVASLKSDKRRLEQDKRELLSRCVKPLWNQSNKRSTSFR